MELYEHGFETCFTEAIDILAEVTGNAISKRAKDRAISEVIGMLKGMRSVTVINVEREKEG